MPRTAAVLLASVALAAAKRHKERTYHHGVHPERGHTQNAGEYYPGHSHHEQHPHLAPKHSNHEMLTAALVCNLEDLRDNLRKGVPVDFPHDDSGDTALMYAAMDHAHADGRAVECLKVLLGAGANVERADYEGRTALMLAAMRSGELTRLLLEAGAHAERAVKSGPDRGLTALDLAVRHKCDQCASLLRTALEKPERVAALASRKAAAESSLRHAMWTYTWIGKWYAWWEGFPSGDECWLHRALDSARHTPGVDRTLIADGQRLRGPLREEVLDLLERKHLCEEVAPYLLSHRLYTLDALRALRLPQLAKKTKLPAFESHMLERHVRLEIERHAREKRARDTLNKEEVRRLQERGCGY